MNTFMFAMKEQKHILNGYAPFSKPFSGSKVGGLNRSEWVDMLRFRHAKG